MKLRIVAGELGGRVISVPRRPGIRPTSERVREAWFSALGARLTGAEVIDLFAGSGALGIEALSRGATRAEFIESDGRLRAALEANLLELELCDRAQVVRQDVFSFLARLGTRRWHVALADPPYRRGLAARLAERFRARPFAEVLCVEHEPGALSPELGSSWSRRYGDSQLTFLEPDE